ncbi:lytic transglycosylase domain-containing protein [Methylocystis hirsuta]|uniref:Lytic transglycosylase domain-containing protein n=2 Tax=Methylocystis hirsuta TaxID=369798 RepID=A0A3M9XJY9_9HYPH|nr:lytic transglycosylase domain-containing protein [Methylocystis hirsuta]
MDDASLRDLVAREATSVGVDGKLALTILSLESNDGADLNSRKGARGPLQLMPSTAAQYGVHDICNPAENVHGAMLFLRDLSAQFGGNLMLIVAAYNAGPERVYQSRGVPAIAETVRYVANATNKYYGLEGASTRQAGGVAKQSRFHAPSIQETTEKPKADSKGPQWIGGSVLYVSSDDQENRNELLE